MQGGAPVLRLALLALLAPGATTFRAAVVPPPPHSASAAAAASRAPPHARHGPSGPAMVFGLTPPRDASAPLGAAPFGGMFGAARPETLYESGTPVDFLLETLHITKRRVSGGVLVRAPADAVWSVLTDYEAMPEVIPNILSNKVVREGKRVLIEQESLLSNRLQLRVDMSLEAVEQPGKRKLTLERRSGHGFLEFEAVYNLQPRADGSTYLSYAVELVPCPIFPLPLVERKVRKEVPRMLVAVAKAAARRAR